MAEWNTRQNQNLLYLGSSPSGSTAELGCGSITLLRYQITLEKYECNKSSYFLFLIRPQPYGPLAQLVRATGS